MKVVPCTLAIVRQHGSVLLGLKRAERPFGLYWNGPGGKINVGETPTQAFLRETREECGIVPTAYDYKGSVQFLFRDMPLKVVCHMFEVTEYSGELSSSSSEFSKFRWYPIDALPFDATSKDKGMLPGDRVWLMQLLRGEPMQREFCYDSLDCMNLVDRKAH